MVEAGAHVLCQGALGSELVCRRGGVGGRVRQVVGETNDGQSEAGQHSKRLVYCTYFVRVVSSLAALHRAVAGLQPGPAGAGQGGAGGSWAALPAAGAAWTHWWRGQRWWVRTGIRAHLQQ